MSKLCPFLTYTSTVETEDGKVEKIEFFECMKEKCFAYWSERRRVPNSSRYETLEHCKRLERKA